MVKPRRINDRHLAYYLVGVQALLACLVPLGLLVLTNKDVARAALCGGWIATIANGYFAMQVFRYSGARSSQHIVKSFYRGETGKFILVFLLFIAAFKLVKGMEMQAHILIISFIFVQSIAWFAPWFFRHR